MATNNKLNKKQKISSFEKKNLEQIANYWEDKKTISLMDKNLKSLEINAIKEHLKKNHTVVDIGCGEGQSACECAKFVKTMLAIDNSQNMVNKAKRLAKNKFPNLSIEKMNILELQSLNQKFDVAITDRVITNLPNWELQKRAILDIKSILKKHGKYVLIENFNDGYERLNSFRTGLGLQKIPKHWHNTFLNKTTLFRFLKNHFIIEKQINFNLYYFLTRIYIPMFGSFTGWGKSAKSDPIFKVSDPSAKMIQEMLGNKIQFFGDDFFGPINGLVLIKK
jgi:2-polyprenyl-3-methyl-5-hydroxy-6-metoxy-1,4-benzoquinol methylase